MQPKKIAINGKIFCWPLTGIRRVTEELLLALDPLLSSQSGNSQALSIEIIVPENYPIDLQLKNISIKKGAALKSGYFISPPWEQCLLPLALSKGQTLLNLGNLGPVLVSNSITMIYDAQVFITPESYASGFRWWHQVVTKIIGKRSKKILTISEHSKEQLVKYGISDANKISVIPLGCDHIVKISPEDNILEKLNLTNKKYAVAQARITAYKNIPMLLKAFSSNQLKDVTLVLYGSSIKKNYEDMGLTVPENVLFAGRVTDGELKSLISSAIATLTPSTTEGFGLQPLEGMALGTPAIVAPCGALPEVCADAALYADPNNPEEWIEKIQMLINQKDFTTQLKEKGLLRAKQFTWENAAKKLLSLLT